MMKVEFAFRHIVALAVIRVSVAMLLASPLSAGGQPDQPSDPRFVRFEMQLRTAVAVEDPVEMELWLRSFGPDGPTEPSANTIPIPIELRTLTGRGRHDEYWLVAEGWWSPRVQFRTGKDDGPLILTAFPTSPALGQLVPPPSGDRAAEVTIRFQQAAGTAAQPPVPAGEVHCPVTDGRFECALPQGTLDLRISVDGGATLALPGRVVPRKGALDLGGLTLREPGAKQKTASGEAP